METIKKKQTKDENKARNKKMSEKKENKRNIERIEDFEQKKNK